MPILEDSRDPEDLRPRAEKKNSPVPLVFPGRGGRPRSLAVG